MIYSNVVIVAYLGSQKILSMIGLLKAQQYHKFLYKSSLLGLMRNPETRGGHPRKFDPRTRHDPKKQNPNQRRRHLILNFTLKIPETPKTRGGRPQNVDPRTRPDPKKQTPNPTFAHRIHHYLHVSYTQCKVFCYFCAL